MPEAFDTESFKGVWVFAEQRRGKLLDVSMELLNIGDKLSKDLGERLTAILFGSNVESLAKELIAFGADEVYMVEMPQLDLYQSDLYVELLAELINKYRPEVVLIGATTVGKDLASRVAAKLKTGLTADCIDLYINEKRQLVQTVPGFGGNVMVNCICPNKRPQMATVRPGVFDKATRNEGRSGKIIKIDSDVKNIEIKAKTIEIIDEESKEPPLEKAEIVVACGWGVGSQENFELVKELAKILGGAIGGTRPAVDKGWISEDQMIGQSGKIVRPRLYIGVGISGAMHHIVGMKDSKVIVAINKDPHAPIFKVVDFGILGDLCEVLPCLIEEFKKKLRK